MKKIHWGVVLAGVAVGLAALILTAMGNPANMGFCIACFLRDTAGACGLHSAAKVQYVRPEIIGLVLGAFLMSVAGKEFKARAGSSPALRFVIGGFVVIGALAFLGCPLRMVLRLGGGDLNALVGLIGFFIGILIGIACLKRGFTLKRSYEVSVSEGSVLPTVMAALLILVLTVPALFKASEAPWVRSHVPGEKLYVTDGPFLLRNSRGELLMLWSSFTDEGYAIGLARSRSGDIGGPWEQFPQPIFRRDGGHGMILRTFDGRLLLSIHQPNRTPDERTKLFPLRETADGGLEIAGDALP